MSTLVTRGIVADLAAWALGVQSTEISPAAMHAARRLLLDRVGISLGGLRLVGPHPTLRLAARFTGNPSATLLGGGRAFAPYAALANGCAGDALELAAGPDCVEAGLAAAEIADATLDELLVAIAVGAEVAGYLRRWLSEAMEKHGIHPPAGLGAFSAAITAGRLLGLSPERLAGALGSVGSLMPQAPFGVFTGGAPSKSLYGGWPQMLGLWSCLWATGGTVGPTTVLEGSRGVAQALLDAGGAVIPPIFTAPTDTWEVERITFKPFPSCRACHPTLTALASLGAIDPNAVTSVHIATYPYAVALEGRTTGTGPIATQASVSRSVALALVYGGTSPLDMADSAASSDERVVAMEARTTVEVDPLYAGSGPRIRGAHVTVTLRDGATLAARADEPQWGPSSPATDAELRDRFALLVGAERTAFGDAIWSAPGALTVRALIAAHSAANG